VGVMQTSKDIESKSLDRRVRSGAVSYAVCLTRRRAMVLQAINPNTEHGSISPYPNATGLRAACRGSARVMLAESSRYTFGEIRAEERSENAPVQIAPSHSSASAWQHASPQGSCIMLPTSPSPPVLAYNPTIHAVHDLRTGALYSCASADAPATLALQPYCYVPMPQQLDHPAPLPSSEPSEPSSHQRHVCSKSCSLTGKERNTNPDEVACTGTLFSCALFCIALHCLASLGTLSTKQCTNTPLVRALLCIVSHVQCISAGYTQQSVKAISCPSWRNTAAV